MQRQGEAIDLTCLAYFAALSDDISEDILGFLTADAHAVVPPVENWETQIAALHFGVELGKAAQVLLHEPIRSAILANDFEEFIRLSTVPGFGHEFERVIASPPTAGSDGGFDFMFVTNAALLLAQVDEMAAWKGVSWGILATHYFSMSVPDDVPKDLGLRVRTFAEQAPTNKKGLLIKSSADMIAAIMETTPINPEVLSIAFQAAEEIVELAGTSKVETPLFELAAAPTDFLKVVAEASKKKVVWKRFRTSHTPKQLVAGLTANLESAEDGPSVPESLKIIVDPDFASVMPASAAFDWTPLTAAASQVAENTPGAEAKSAAAIAALGILQLHFDGAGTNLTELIDQGHLLNRFNEAYSAKNIDLVSSVAAIFIIRGRDFGAPNGITWESLLAEYPGFVKSIREKLDVFSDLVVMPIVWAALTKCPTSKILVNKVANYMVSGGGLGTLYVEDTLKAISDYLAPLEEGSRAGFLNRLRHYGDPFWKSLEKIPLDANFHTIATSLRRAPQSERQRGLTLVRRRLEQVPNADWQLAIEKGAEPFSLAIEFAPLCEPSWHSKTGLYEALISTADKMIGSFSYPLRKRWFDLATKINPKTRKGLYKSLANSMAIARYIAEPVSIMRIGGTPLLTSSGFTPEAAMSAILIPLSELADGRRWLRDHSDEVKAINAKASSNGLSLFQKKLDRLARSKNSGRREWAEKMTALLGSSRH